MNKLNTQPNRREFLKTTGLATLALSMPIAAKSNELLVYIGTYTNKGTSDGIYICKLNLATGALTKVGSAKSQDPAFLAIDRKRKFLYAANEIGEFNGKKSGAVSAFAINQKTGELTFLNQQATNSPGPCSVTVDKTGKCVLAANYSGGSVTAFPVKADGSLSEASDLIQHQGSSVNPNRQKEPHAHTIIIDDSNRYAFCADLGMDKVMIYKLDAKRGKLTPNTQAFAAVKPGAGPRHFKIHPNNKFAYVINELDETVIGFAFDKAGGTLKEIQTISTLPADFTGTSYCADIHVHPSGKFLYGSNRGHDSIVVFAIERATGKLTLVQHQATGGKWPRNFAVDPTGQFLLVANQNTNNIVVFRIEAQTGNLMPTNQMLEIPLPVCLKLIPTFS
ncbi:MAG: lactonase family protein [Blastocatellia bacterium]|nr:lactonase family protein [Blastocatellia bacterium]